MRDLSLKLCDFGFARAMPHRDSPLTDYVATRWSSQRAPCILHVNKSCTLPDDLYLLLDVKKQTEEAIVCILLKC